MYWQKVSTLTVLVLCSALLFAGCGAKTLATPQADVENAGLKEMHQIAVDHQAAAAAWSKGCNPTARTIAVGECNKWDTFDTAFRVRYRVVGATLAPADIAQLRNDLNPWKR